MNMIIILKYTKGINRIILLNLHEDIILKLNYTQSWHDEIEKPYDYHINV